METGSHYVAQAGLKLMGSSDPSASAPHSVGITSVSHYPLPSYVQKFKGAADMEKGDFVGKFGF